MTDDQYPDMTPPSLTTPRPDDWPVVLETLYESETRFQEAFESAPIGMALVSPVGRWLRVNPALCGLLGYTPDELFALTFQELTYPPDLDADLELAQELLAGSIRTYQLEKRYIHRQGHLVWGLLSVSLVRSTTGQPRYFVSQVQDITERKEMELALRESEARFRALFEHSPDGVLLIDPHHPSGLWPIVDCNAAACAMNGYTREELIGRPIDILNANASDSSDRAAYLDRLRRLGTMYVDVMHRRADGTLFPVAVSTSLITIGDRELVLGIDRDQTALRSAEAALRQANEELAAKVAALERHMQMMQLLTDMGTWLHACQEADEVAAVVQRVVEAACPGAAGALVVRTDADTLVKSWGAGLSVPARPALESCRAVGEQEPWAAAEACAGCDALWRCAVPRSWSLCVPLCAMGAVLGVLRVQAHGDEPAPPSELQQQAITRAADQSALALANIGLRQSLHRQAIRDPLTGLFNRRYMDEALAREIHRARRHAGTVGVMLVDIDHFKAFNDTFGHQAGDALLRVVGAHLQSHIRSDDIACRYGGEEFLIILVGVDGAMLLQRAEDLRAGIAQLSVAHRGQQLGPVTVSVGAALFPQHGDTAAEVIQAADAALYRAKQTGRNRVIVAAPASGGARGSAG